MAKKGNYSKPLGNLGIKQKQYAKALERVLKHNKSEGFYLSKYQLISLGSQLESMIDGPEGIWFAIGETKINSKKVKTVETIPYEIINSGTGQFKIWEIDNIIGDLKVSLGNLEINNNQKEKFDKQIITKIAETHGGDPIKPDVVIMPGGPSSSQRTPPPHIGQ